MAQGFDNILNMAKTGAKAGLEYTPYVGDVYDIARGGYQAFHGHPWLGTGQAALGGAGLAANLMFPGAGSLTKAGAKGVIKNLVKMSPKAAKGIRNYAKFNRSLKGQALTSVLPEFGYAMTKNNNKADNINNVPPLEVINDGSVNGDINTARLSENVQQPVNSILGQVTQEGYISGEQQPNIDVINNYVQQLKDINQPYVDALQNYLNNYNDLYKRNYNAQRYWTAMSGLAKNPSYSRVADSYNPLLQEANRLNAIKQLQQAQATDVNAINEMMGNLAAVQQMGLTPETAFANKNLLTMMAAKDREDNRLQIALENNLMKKYGIDRNYARALTVQAMRNQGAMDRAILNAQTFGYGGYQPAPGLTQQGQARPPMAINQVQSQNDIASLFPPKK